MNNESKSYYDEIKKFSSIFPGILRILGASIGFFFLYFYIFNVICYTLRLNLEYITNSSNILFALRINSIKHLGAISYNTCI